MNFLQVATTAQNLVPNGSFEIIENSSCNGPENSFSKLTDWYSIQGTPDLFVANCPIPDNAEVFWTDNSFAAEGQNFMGFKCRVNSNQSYLSEGIATQLSKTLENDQAYFISLKLRNKGIYQGFPASVISCPLKPQKQIEIYTHSDSIKVVNDFSNGSAESNAELVTTFNSPLLVSDNISRDWSLIGTCFVADEDVNFISLIMPLGNFGEFPPCSADDTKGTFFSYYFELDDIIVDLLPEDTLITRSFAEGSEFEIFIPQELNLPFLSDAVIKWADGYEGSRRTLDKPGVYEMDIILDCGSISVTLDLVPQNTEFPFFIPNVFSPNDDGVNDFLEIFIPNDKEVTSYSLSIFDRWGNLVFTTNEFDTKWNGRIGAKASSGQFIYHLTCTLNDETGQQEYFKTDLISIIR